MVKKLLMKDYTSLGKAKLFNKMSFKFHKMTLSTFSKEILNSIFSVNTATIITKIILSTA